MGNHDTVEHFFFDSHGELYKVFKECNVEIKIDALRIWILQYHKIWMKLENWMEVWTPIVNLSVEISGQEKVAHTNIPQPYFTTIICMTWNTHRNNRWENI